MDFVHIATYENYIDAHISMGQLEESGIRCWLKDENTLSVNPMWSQAIGGIKLMVAEEDAEDARVLLTKYAVARIKPACSSCGGSNIEVVTTPRKVTNWFLAFLGAVGSEKVYHCFDCNNEMPVGEEEPS